MRYSRKLILLFLLSLIGTGKGFASKNTEDASLLSLNKFYELTEEKNENDSIDNKENNFIKFIKYLFPSIGNDNSSEENIIKLIKYYKSTPLDNKGFLIKPVKGDQFVVWGGLQGGVSTLLHSLNYLKENGIIGDDLVIQRNNIKFIFLGNTLARSRKTFSTLQLILTLMIKNPGKIFFLKGENEREVEKIFYEDPLQITEENHVPNKDSITSHDISQFISQLSETLRLYSPDQNKSILFTGKTFPLASSMMVDNSINPFGASKRTKEKPLDQLPLVRLQNFDRSKSYSIQSGADQLAQFDGANTWTISSRCPGEDNRGCKNDLETFSIVEINDDLYQSSLTLYTHSPELQGHFKPARKFLLNGTRVDASNNENKEPSAPIFIATSMDLTEGSSTFGKRVLYGTDLKVRKQNEKGGINGNTLHVFYSNDKYLPSLALGNAKYYIEDQGIQLFLSPLGAPTVSAMLDYANEGKVAIVFPVSGSPVFRQPNLGTIVNYRASYDDEIQALLHYAKKNLLKQKFAIFYNSNKTGALLGDKAKDVLLNEFNVKPESVCQVKIPPNSVDMSQAAKKIEECDPDVILFLTSYSSSRALVNKVGVQFLSNVTLMGYSFITDRFKQFVSGSEGGGEGLGLEFVMARVVPNPKTSKLAIVKEYRDYMNQVYPDASYDTDSLEAYINASILINVLEILEPPYIPHKVISFIKSLKDYQFKDLNLTYDEKIFGFSKDIWLDIGEGEWKHYDINSRRFVIE